MFDADDPNATSMQERLESATEALRVIVMFASKDVTEFPRIFFTNDVIALLCDESRPSAGTVLHCAGKEGGPAVGQNLCAGLHELFV